METCHNISIAGGGTKGIMLIGMLKAFDQHMPIRFGKTRSEYFSDFKMYAGTSCGSAVALMLLLDIETATLCKILEPYLLSVRSILPNPDLSMLFERFGLDDASAIRTIVAHTLRAAGLCEDATFHDIQRLLRKDFSCVASNISTKCPVYFSPDTTPNLAIADAVLMSCTLPFVYAPLKHNDAYMLDGVLTHNIPRNTPIDDTLFVDFGYDTNTGPVSCFNDYMCSVMSFTFERSDGSWYKDRPTIRLKPPPEIQENRLNFDMGQESVGGLLKIGYSCTLETLYPGYMLTIVAAICMVYETFLEQYFSEEAAGVELQTSL